MESMTEILQFQFQGSESESVIYCCPELNGLKQKPVNLFTILSQQSGLVSAGWLSWSPRRSLRQLQSAGKSPGNWLVQMASAGTAHFRSPPLRGLPGFLRMEIPRERGVESRNAQALFNPLLASHWLMSP